MNPQERIQERIAFLEKQLDSLDHYLPETYRLITTELDIQMEKAMEYKIESFYKGQINEQ